MTTDIRPITLEDIMALNGGKHPEYRIHGYSCYKDGELVGCGGLAFLPNGGTMMFLNTVDNWQKRLPIALVKTFYALLNDATSMDRRHIYAYPQPELGETAVRFLERLGFKLDEDGGFYKWHS